LGFRFQEDLETEGDDIQGVLEEEEEEEEEVPTMSEAEAEVEALEEEELEQEEIMREQEDTETEIDALVGKVSISIQKSNVRRDASIQYNYLVEHLSLQ
jgi:hypothetical protein